MSKYIDIYINNEHIGTCGKIINPEPINSNKKTDKFNYFEIILNILLLILCIRIIIFG